MKTKIILASLILILTIVLQVLADTKIIPIIEVLHREGEMVTVRGELVGQYSKISVFKDGRHIDNLWAFFIDENPEDKRMFKRRTHILVLFQSNKDILKLDLSRPIEVTGKATNRIGQIWSNNFVPGLNLEAGFKEWRIEATEVRQAD